ncbi:kinesin-like protein KIN-12E isoform X2 [Nematostella vectensis]|uniref:kinesin-like protein KIN-12E isoform X2 n=1 Tax=Nematostella vectensis TaxID=45351 RepID=UPI0020771000|nr:kinesin-like protein KIN-12E isoform X2 [Nematostella vectensis]
MGGSQLTTLSKRDIILRQKTEELDEAMQEMKRLEMQVKTQKEENNNKKKMLEEVNKSISENRKLMEDLLKEQEERDKLMEDRENEMCLYIASLTVSQLVDKTVNMCDTCEKDRAIDELHSKKASIELVEQQEILNNMKKTGDDLDREISQLQRQLEVAKAKPATAEIACQASIEMSNSEVQTTCASTNECETQTEIMITIKVTQETQTDSLPERQGNPVSRAWRRLRERVRSLRDRLFPGAAAAAQ